MNEQCFMMPRSIRRNILHGISKSEWLRYIPTLILALAYILPLCIAEDEAFMDGYYDDQKNDEYYGGDDGVDDTDDTDDNFYNIQDDDYVSIEHQSSKIYVSSISDVILCLLCTFFWVLWLVGTIFPSRIQDLYRNEGIVVRGDVLESYTSNDPTRDEPVEEGIEEMDDDTMFDGPTLPTYHAIVSYVVPARVVRGRRGMSGAVQIRMKHIERNNMSFDSIDPRVNDTSRSPPKTRRRSVSPQKERTSISPPKTRNRSNSPPILRKKSISPGRDAPKVDHNVMMKSLSRQLNARVNKINESPRGRRGETPPRPPRSMMTPTKTQNPKQKSLLDGFSQSFDTDCYFAKNSKGDIEKQTPKKESPSKPRLQNDDVPYYQYNRPYVYYIDDDEGDDHFDPDPEKIGSFFQSLDVHSKHYASLGHFLASLGLVTKESSNVSTTHSDKKTVDRGPLRVKKRFDTSHFLRPGHNNVEVIVLPGNPGSGILKSEFEEEDFMLNGNSSFTENNSDDEIDGPKTLTGGGLTDLSSGIIGVCLAAVSTIGAVHGALTLPYKTRVYGWILVVFSLSIMWPAAMLTYKTVNRLRLFMMNKIISFEPCGEKSALYRLRNLPRAKLTSCSGNSGNNSGRRDSESGGEGDYVIMVDTSNDYRESHRAPSFHDDSSVSSLSGDLKQIV